MSGLVPKVLTIRTKMIDILFLARPALLCASCAFFFAGAVSAVRHTVGLHSIRSTIPTVTNLVLFALVTSFAFVVNQILDVGSDRLNRKVFILPAGVVKTSESIAFAGILGVLAFALSLSRATTVRYLAWAGLALGFAYSVPPMRLKGRPVGDLLANVIGFGFIGFAMGWLALAGFSSRLVVRSLPYAIAMAAIFLNTCIPDEEGDRAAGDCTSCVVFGKTAASRAALILLSLSGLVGFAVGETPCALAALGTMPAFVATAAEPTPANSVVASQFAARVLFVVVSFKAPVLALLGVATYVSARLYYGRRFRVGYPNLKGAEVRDRQSVSP